MTLNSGSVSGGTFLSVLKKLFLFCVLAGLTGSCLADGVPRLEAKKLSLAPTIDGVLSPGEWEMASKVEALRDRVTGQFPSAEYRTEVYMGYNKEAIFVAFYCHDSEPEKIVGREIQPNSEFRGEDTVTVDLNLFGTRAYDQLNEFIVNSIGTQTERIAGGRSSKREWRGLWTAKTSKAADGWICEIAIPWKMLNFPEKKRLDVDLNLIRKQGRTLFEQSLANYRPNPLPELQGVWESVEPPAPPKAKPQFLAYSALDTEGGTVTLRQGLDAKYAFTSSLNGLVSVSPDFRNVEDVIAGNDFVRVERFLNDPRPFFQEGSNFFELTDRFSFGRMFYTRRISQFDIGMKTFGLINPKLSVGAMHTSTVEGEKSTVVKFANTISGTQSQRAFFTSTNLGGVVNSSFGGSINKRWDTVGLSMEVAGEKNAGSKLDTAGSFQVSYNRPTTYLSARYTWVSPEFGPSLGFVPWRDRKGFNFAAMLNRNWRSGIFRDYGIFAIASEYRTYDTNEIQEGGYSISGDLSTMSDLGLSLVRTSQTFFGKRDDITGFGLTFNKSNRFKQLGFYTESGTRGDRPSSYYSLNGTFRIGNNFDIGLRQSLLELDGTDKQTILSALWQKSNDTTISTRIATTPGGTNAYLSFRKAGNAGAEYYMILGDPNALSTTNRLSLKAIWAF